MGRLAHFSIGLLAIPCVLLAATVVEPVGKGAAYFQLLERNPRPGYLFERFRDAWLEQHDVQELEAFLSQDGVPPLLLAFHYEAVFEYPRAVDIYTEVLDGQPGRPEVLFYRAAAQMRADHYSPAMADLEAVMEAKPGPDLEAKALKLLGRAQVRSGQTKEGLASWRKLLDLSGGDPDVADEILDLLLAEGFYEEALAHCDRMLASEKDAYRKVNLHGRRAAVLVRMDRCADAIEALCTAYGMTAQESWLRRDLLARLGMLYRGVDDLDGLCKRYASMLETWPDSPLLLQSHAGALLELGKAEDALGAARNVVELMPGRQDVREWYVDLLVQAGEDREAATLLEGLLEQSPGDNALRLRLAVLANRAGDGEKTVFWIREYLAHSNQAEADYLRAARELVRYGMDNEATSVYSDMLARWPESLTAREMMALHLTRKSGLQLQLAMKHYLWLAERCDLDTLLRLAKALMAADAPDKAGQLLDMRAGDFQNDTRFLSEQMEVALAEERFDDALEWGMQWMEHATTFAELERSGTALVYLLKNQGKAEEWQTQLEGGPSDNMGRIWLLALLTPNVGDKVLEKGLESHPGNAELMQCRLALARRDRDWNRAEGILLDLINQAPRSKAKWLRELVAVLNRAGKTDEALQRVGEWKLASPNATRPYELERDILVSAGRPDEAVEALRRAVARFDDSKQLKQALGRLYESTNRKPEAELLYWRMLNAEEELDARMAVLADLIRVARARGGLDLLVKELEQRAEQSSSALFPLLGLAECHRVGRNNTARGEALGRVLELQPNNVAVLREKARLEEELGNYTGARNLMLRIADADATGAAFAKVVEYEVLFGDEQEAARLMEDPRFANNLDGFVALAESMLEKGCLPAMADALEARAAKEDADYRLLYLNGVALEEAGQTKRAIAAFGRVMRLADDGSEPPLSAYRMAARSKPRSSYQDEMPDELLAVTKGMGVNSAAYGYRNSSTSYSAYRVPWPPNGSDTAKQYAMHHLHKLFGQLPREEALELAGALERDVPYARLLTLGKLAYADGDWWEEVLELYPDSDGIALWRLAVAPQTLEEDEVRSAVAGLPDNFPNIRFRAVWTGMNTHSNLVDLLPEAAAPMLDHQADLRAMWTLIRYAATKKDVQPAIITLLEQIEQRAEAMDGFPEEELLQIRMACALGAEDYGTIVDYMHKMFRRELPMAGMRRPRSQSTITRRLAFPPRTLFDSEARFLYGLDAQKRFFKEGMREAVRASDDDLFRTLALQALKAPGEEVEKGIGTIEAKPEKSIDEQLTLACWYTGKNPEKTLEHLLNLAEENTDAAHRQAVEKALLAAASAVDPLPEGMAPRLRTQVEPMFAWARGDRTARIQLLGLMEQLDIPLERLIPEAKTLMAATSAKPPPRKVAAKRPPDPYTRFRSWLDKGRTEVALEQLTMMLRSEAQRLLYGTRPAGNSNHYLRNCISEAKRRNLDGELLTKLQPSKTNPHPRRLFEYGYACEMLSFRAAALEAYARLHEMRPEWRGATIRYCMLLATDNAAKAEQIADGLPVELLGGMAASLQTITQNRSTTHEQRLALCRLSVRFMEREGAADIRDLFNTALTLQRVLANNAWYEDERSTLPGLFSREERGVLAPGWEPPQDPSGNLAYLEDEALVAVQQERRELLVRMCTALVENNLLVNNGFTQMAAWLDHSGKPVDGALFALAERIVQSKTRPRWNYSGPTGNGRVVEPVAFYLTRMHNDGRMGEVRQWLDADGNKAVLSDTLNTLLEIHEAAETNYLEIVEAAMDSPSRNSDFYGALFALHRLDGRQENLDGVVEQYIRENRDRLSYSSTQGVINEWMNAKLRDADAGAAAAIMETLLECIFTEQERATIAAAEDGSLGNSSHSDIYQKYQRFGSAMRKVEIPLDALPDVVGLVGEYDRKIVNGNAAYFLVQDKVNTPVSYEFLEAFHFLDGLGTFRFYELPGRRILLFDQVMSRLTGGAGKRVLEQVNALEEPTFGSGLVSIFLETSSHSERPRKVFDYLGSYADAIAVDPAAQARLFRWIRGLERSYRTSMATGTNTLAVLYGEWKQRDAQAQLQKLMELKTSDALTGWSARQRQWSEVTRTLAVSHPEQVGELFEHVVRLRRLYGVVQGRTVDSQDILRSVFSNPIYSADEARMAVHFAGKLGDASAGKWLEDYNRNLGYRLFDQVERRVRAEGITNYQKAGFVAAKEVVLALLAADATSIVGLQACLRRVNQKHYADFASWLAEQEVTDTTGKKLVAFYVAEKEADTKWFKSFLLDDSKDARLRLDAYGWLGSRGHTTPKALSEPEVLVGLMELVEQDGSVKLPVAAFWNLLEQARQIAADGERAAMADRLLALWDANRVTVSRTDRNTLFKVAPLAALVGQAERAERYLAEPDLAAYPQTYAIALNAGLDGFVAGNLPRTILKLRNGFRSSDCSISPEAAARREAVAAQIDDAEMGLMVEFFIAALKVKGEKNRSALDKEALQPLLQRAAAELENPDYVQWVVSTMNYIGVKEGVEAITRRYAESVSILEVLRANDSGISTAYNVYLGELAAETNFVRLLEIAGQLDGHVGNADASHANRRKVCEKLVEVSVTSGNDELVETGIRIGMAVEKLRNPKKKPTREDVLKTHGIVVFDPVAYGLDIGDDVERLEAFVAFDASMRAIVKQKFEVRCKAVAGASRVDDAVRSQVRREMVADWIQRAGEDGFLPLCRTCGDAFYLYRTTPEYRIAFHDWLTQQGDSLMVQQLKACLATIQIQRRTKGGVWLEDLRRYLGNGKVDAVERVRFLNRMKLRSSVSDQYANLQKEIVAAYREAVGIVAKYGAELFPFIPVPNSKADVPIYMLYADAELEKLLSKTTMEKRSKAVRKSAVGLLPTLFALDRPADALKLLDDKDLMLFLRPDTFALAIEENQTDWCARHLKGFVTGYVPDRRFRAGIPRSRQLQKIIDAEADPDVQMAARLLFNDLAPISKNGIKMMWFDGSDPAAHIFKDPLCAMQVHRLMEQNGMVGVPDIGRYALEWGQAVGNDTLVERLAELTPLEKTAFSRYVGGMLDNGDVDEVCALYEKLLEKDFDEVDANWLIGVIVEPYRLLRDAYGGKKVQAPIRYEKISTEAWYRLLLLIDRLHVENKVVNYPSTAVASAGLAICVWDGHPERFETLQRRRADHVADLFTTFVAFGGVLRGEPGDEELQKVLEKFHAAYLVFERYGKWGNMGSCTWDEASRTVLKTYPYCEDKEKWIPVLDGLVPE